MFSFLHRPIIRFIRPQYIIRSHGNSFCVPWDAFLFANMSSRWLTFYESLRTTVLAKNLFTTEEKKSPTSWMTWQWVHKQLIFIFGWIIPVKLVYLSTKTRMIAFKMALVDRKWSPLYALDTLRSIDLHLTLIEHCKFNSPENVCNFWNRNWHVCRHHRAVHICRCLLLYDH